MPKRTSLLASSARAIDPTLDALFSASAGPVKAPSKSRYSASREEQNVNGRPEAELGSDEDDEALSEISEVLDDSDNDGDEEHNSGNGGSVPSAEDDANPTEALSQEEEDAAASSAKRERKRKRKDKYEELEGDYLAKLSRGDEAEPEIKRQRGGEPDRDDADGNEDEAEDEGAVPLVHETLIGGAESTGKATELEKADRTVFLSNVSTDAISSKTDKKTLLNHLSSILDKDAAQPQKVESIRFRSVAFSAGSMPKRAAYITKNLMDATTKSANAYVVYSSVAAARKAVAGLNGTEVLGRHLRVDSVTHPSPTDHRRCIFVGNLHFVDDETVLSTDGGGEKKRTKVPADVEEGLWRTFGKKGKVENVRVVRDPKTRVGKGFAYVQFYDANSVESAILLDGKKFPPMLPRILRVARAKDPRKTSLAQERARGKEGAANGAVRNTKYKPKVTPEEQSMAGRAGRLLGRAGAAQQRRSSRLAPGGLQKSLPGIKNPEQIVFEGRRVSSRDALPKDLKGKKGKKAGKPKGRGTRRAAEWRKKS